MSRDILPLNLRSQRPTATVRVRTLCPYHQQEVSLQRGEECFLVNNSNRSKWTVCTFMLHIKCNLTLIKSRVGPIFFLDVCIFLSKSNEVSWKDCDILKTIHLYLKQHYIFDISLIYECTMLAKLWRVFFFSTLWFASSITYVHLYCSEARNNIIFKKVD